MMSLKGFGRRMCIELVSLSYDVNVYVLLCCFFYYQWKFDLCYYLWRGDKHAWQKWKPASMVFIAQRERERMSVCQSASVCVHVHAYAQVHTLCICLSVGDCICEYGRSLVVFFCHFNLWFCSDWNANFSDVLQLKLSCVMCLVLCLHLLTQCFGVLNRRLFW